MKKTGKGVSPVKNSRVRSIPMNRQKQLVASGDILDDIRWILYHFEPDEYRGFLEDGEPEGHIYWNIQRVREWVNSDAEVLNNGGQNGKK